MAGFDNEPSKQEFRRYTSWGRTRQPKNLTGAHRGYVLPVAGNTVGDALTTLNADDTAARAARGYSTENQRYLHITVSASASVSNLLVYSHATDTWTELIVGGASVAVAETQSEIVEIAGVDRVAFRGTANANDKVFLSASTF